jgi:uracil-DNA glycosylase
VILLGQSPYATFKEGIPIADGLLMGCSKTNILQPSLQQFYNACERELFNGLALSYKKDPDVTYLAKQGVLMLNAALTTEINKPGSHLLIWEPFMKYLFTEVMSGVNVPIVLLGKDAQKIEKYISPFTHIIKLSHPASASYAKEDWDAKGMFKEINEVLKYNNGESIQWMEEGSDLPF